MELANYKSKIREHGLVLLFFVLLTLILTYPVITHLTTHLPGDGGDRLNFMWGIWHVSRVLTEGGGISDLYHSDLLFYPNGASLELHTFSLTNTFFLAFPLTLITNNLVLIYNILFFFNFIMAGYAMYLLVKYLVKDRAIAFLVGFAYTFSPLHVAWQTAYLNLMSFLWTPLFLLFFFKMFEEKKLINAIIAAIFLFFLALAGWHHLLFVFLIAAPYFIYKLITVRHFFTKHFFIRIALLLSLFMIIIWPLVLPLLSARLEGIEHWDIGDQYDDLTLFHYVVPSVFHPLWEFRVVGLREGAMFQGINSQARISNATVALGYLVIFVSLLYLVKTKKHLFWFLMAAFFALISVNFQGVVVFVLEKIPILKSMGAISKFSFVVLFSLLLFFAFGLRYFFYSSFLVKVKILRQALAVIAFIILTVEYLPAPYRGSYSADIERRSWQTVIESAEEVGQAIKESHPIFGTDFGVLTFPAIIEVRGAQLNNYFQVFHGKPIFGGDVSRPRRLELELVHLIYFKAERIFYKQEVNEIQQFIEDHRVGYIIGLDPQTRPKVAKIILGSAQEEPQLISEELLFWFSSLQHIPGELVFRRPGGFYVYEVLPEK